MTEKDLINKIKTLKQIKPQKDWVILSKNRILEQETDKAQTFVSFFPFFKPALATLTVFAIFFGLFGFAQTSVPGEFLYPMKRMAERSQSIFVPEQNKLQNSLKLADKRLEELTRIVESNQVKNLPQAINEVQTSVSEAARNISKIEATSSSPVAIKDMVNKTQELEFKIEEATRSLGVVIDNDELQGVSIRLKVKDLINDLEAKTLTEEEQETLAEMKELAENQEYAKVLEMFLLEFDQAEEIKDSVEEKIEEEIEEEDSKKDNELTE